MSVFMYWGVLCQPTYNTHALVIVWNQNKPLRAPVTNIMDYGACLGNFVRRFMSFYFF